MNRKNLKAFFTSFNPLSYAKMLTTSLANQLFSHLLHKTAFKSAFKPTSNDNQTDNRILFIYIVTNQYISNKFFRIIIDISASIYSIAEYGQFLAYSKYNPIHLSTSVLKGQLIYNLVLALFYLWVP